MKITFRNTGLVIATVALTTIAFGQKKNVTSAAVEYNNNFMPALAKQDMEAAKKSIIVAKEFIDLAVEHPDTKEDQKALWYNGEIYGSLAFLLVMDSTLAEMSPEAALDKSLASLDKGYDLGKKYQQDIKETANKAYSMFFMSGSAAYEKEMFAEAAEGYDYAAQYKKAIDEVDTLAIFNAALCYEKADMHIKAAENYSKLYGAVKNSAEPATRASINYRAAKDLDKARAMIDKARKEYPSNKELLIELVNINLDSGDAAGAEKALNDAIASDPNNMQLYYTIGTIYIDLKEDQKAEDALRKALEIEPGNANVQYQLGAHLYNWANTLKLEANKMDKGDPREDEYIQMSEEKMSAAIEVLELYLEKDPDNTDILDILYRGYYKSGNNEKAMEYKKRLDALK